MKEKINTKDELDLTVVVTCYNEEQLIVDTLETVNSALRSIGCTYEIIVIDDVSTDNSVIKIDEYIKTHSDYPIQLKVNEVNRGLANNFVEGAFLGRGKYYRLCCGDNAEPKETLIHLFKQIGKAEMIIPYQNQDKIAGKSPLRRILSKTVVFLVNWISGFSIKYYNGLPIFLKYHVMRWPPISYGFGFQMDIITRLLDEGVTYVQIPSLGTIDRKGEDSVALSMRNLFSVAHTMIEIAFRRIRRLLYHKHLPKSVEIKIDEHV